MVQLFWKYLPVPLRNSHLESVTHDSKNYRLDEGSKLYQLAAAQFNREYSLLTKLDYLKKLKAECCTNAARFSNQPSVGWNYASVKRSSDLIKAWLRYQFEGEWMSVLHTIYRVVTLQNGQKNTIHFWGDCNSGHTGTLRPLAELFVLVGFVSGGCFGSPPFASECNWYRCFKTSLINIIFI